ncbi:hypothetical protein SKAU_G00143400 [Synaphobranchus kaupii]|uniref:Uncharacterized protein n=1 Tax=Synaphobranchus kaupii TaxID=118154 RepID=A0A9Q1J3I8_SYNKA|nr:hypothetical protein SKAU_G00143400 [Synaphobranchus kaupii]
MTTAHCECNPSKAEGGGVASPRNRKSCVQTSHANKRPRDRPAGQNIRKRKTALMTCPYAGADLQEPHGKRESLPFYSSCRLLSGQGVSRHGSARDRLSAMSH